MQADPERLQAFRVVSTLFNSDNTWQEPAAGSYAALCRYAQERRRRAMPRPNRPAPSSAMDAGSGIWGAGVIVDSEQVTNAPVDDCVQVSERSTDAPRKVCPISVGLLSAVTLPTNCSEIAPAVAVPLATISGE